MELIGRLLPFAICPIVMGLAMWLMMRGSSDDTGTAVATDGHSCQPTDRPSAPAGLLRSVWMMVECCLNWKVLATLAIVGAAVWVLAPGTVRFALPVLLVLVCPISMVLMMRRMGGRGRTSALAQESELAALPPAGPTGQLADSGGRLEIR